MPYLTMGTTVTFSGGTTPAYKGAVIGFKILVFHFHLGFRSYSQSVTA